ncbi:unnamed protein product [Rhodiola kirilowii]
MATVQKLRAGSEGSITSIATESILDANYETTTDVSGVVLKVRKPYTISKQREKWTEEEHQKFIEAVKLYGRAWRQIEEYIGTKTAVQIRSHAQKFFFKVIKDGAISADTSTEPIEIPPPRSKRKPLHPYPRKLVEAPKKTQMCPGLKENRTSTTLKRLEREAHSPISVLSPEGYQIYISQAKEQGSGCVSRTSSGSNLSHVVENNSPIKDESTLGKEKEVDLLLTVNLRGPLLDDSTLMSGGNELKDNEFPTDEDNHSVMGINCVGGGGAPLKIIKLFGHTLVVANQSETHALSPVTKLSLNLNNKLVPGGILMGESLRDKEEDTNGFSCTASNGNSFNGVRNAETNLDSVESKMENSQQPNVNPNDFMKGFVPHKS